MDMMVHYFIDDLLNIQEYETLLLNHQSLSAQKLDLLEAYKHDNITQYQKALEEHGNTIHRYKISKRSYKNFYRSLNLNSLGPLLTIKSINDISSKELQNSTQNDVILNSYMSPQVRAPRNAKLTSTKSNLHLYKGENNLLQIKVNKDFKLKADKCFNSTTLSILDQKQSELINSNGVYMSKYRQKVKSQRLKLLLAEINIKHVKMLTLIIL
jgi:hypothetical protein